MMADPYKPKHPLPKTGNIRPGRFLDDGTPEGPKPLAQTENAFCPTGKGGGQDNSCSPHAGKSDSDLHNEIRLYKEVMAPTKANQKRLIALEREAASRAKPTRQITPQSVQAAVAKALSGPETSPEQRGSRFGTDKALLSTVRASLGLDKVEFDRQMLELHKTGAVRLSRADLVAAMHPADLAESEINTPKPGEHRPDTYHFVRKQ